MPLPNEGTTSAAKSSPVVHKQIVNNASQKLANVSRQPLRTSPSDLANVSKQLAGITSTKQLDASKQSAALISPKQSPLSKGLSDISITSNKKLDLAKKLAALTSVSVNAQNSPIGSQQRKCASSPVSNSLKHSQDHFQTEDKNKSAPNLTTKTQGHGRKRANPTDSTLSPLTPNQRKSTRTRKQAGADSMTSPAAKRTKTARTHPSAREPQSPVVIYIDDSSDFEAGGASIQGGRTGTAPALVTPRKTEGEAGQSNIERR